MPCYYPLTAFRALNKNTGETWIKIGPPPLGQKEILLPCGRCIGCKLERARQWATRCVHESKVHQESTFVTLTYATEHLPSNNSVNKLELQKFFRSLRKKLKGRKISYFACGEYGEQMGRPHYHAIIFGWEPKNKTPYKIDKEFGILYTSEELSNYWTKGFSTCGSVTKESAGYVARYTCKKITGENAEKHYNGKTPEFQLQSTKPAIGLRWLKKYEHDVYNYDHVIVAGKETKPPRYYDKKHEEWHPTHMEQIKKKREIEMEVQTPNKTIKKMYAAEQIKKFQINKLKRRLENEP